ncbi:MAG: tyrosine-type recombinase/integrase [Actinobacteria bacterium]|nr:tyrosine-type recombinase/integrase [Actinomycetota bacterium]
MADTACAPRTRATSSALPSTSSDEQPSGYRALISAPTPDELAEHLLGVHDAPDAYVFTAAGGGPLRVTNFRRRRWYPAVEAAGLDGLRLHDLRHTAVSLWIAGGANPKQVSTWAGHTSVSFTLDRYGHLFPNHDEDLRDRLDAMYQAAERDLAERGHVARLERDGR